MVNSINHCADFLPASCSSSCTQYLNHCCQRICNTTGCDGQCYFINDHTYRILKKICRRIFKDYNRAQCLKTYTIFDGGNSVNVRIYRSGQQCEGNVEDGTNDALKLNSQRFDKLGKRKRDTDIGNTNQRKNKENLDKKSRKRSAKEDSSQQNEDEETEKTRKKLKNRSSRKGILTNDDEGIGNLNNHTTRKGMSNKDADDGSYTEKDKQYKNKSEQERKKSKQKQGTIEDAEKYDKKFGKNKTSKNYGNKDDDFDGTPITKRGSRRKSKGYKDDYDIKDRKGIRKSRDIKNYGKKMLVRGSKVVDYRLIKDLRKSVRRGENLDMNNCNFTEKARHSLKSRLGKTKNKDRIKDQKSKISRVDEIKTCDYLRALMEQKDLDQLYCRYQFHECTPLNCNRQVCNPCLCACPDKPSCQKPKSLLTKS